MDLEYVFTQMDQFIWGTGLTINMMGMEGRFLKMEIIIQDFGSKVHIMDQEF